MDIDGCKRFVRYHIEDVKKILKKLEEVDLTSTIDKSKFDVDEIILVDNV